jgi:hypothetical protein
VSIHIQRFVDRLRGFEARAAKDITMSITDAKDLHADITRLLLDLQTAKESAIKATQEETITVEMSGGTFR